MNKKSSQMNDNELPGAPNDAISSLRCSSDGNMLVATSWDTSVRCWALQYGQNGLSDASPHSSINHDAPVLCCDIASDNATIFSGGCDGQVKMWNVPGGATAQQIGQHQAPVRCLSFSPEYSLVVAGSWDHTVGCWDTRSPTPTGQFQVDERVFAMDVKGDACVVATASKEIFVFNMRTGQLQNKTTSPLKYQTRSVALFTDVGGYAVGSVEGRVSVEDFNSKDKSFIFKCHREGGTQTQRSPQQVYGVNGLVFNSINTFATIGSDGCFAFWDKDVRHRLSIHERFKNQCPITCAAFHPNDMYFFYALSYDWSKGADGYQANTMANRIMAHPIQHSEIRHTGAKK